MAAFLDDVIFPVEISRGSTGGPEWKVDIVTLASGREERNTPWAAPLRSYDARWAIRDKDELYQILELYHITRGPLYGFRMKDWTDFQSCAPSASPSATDQSLGTGDGSTTTFELNKTYTVGSHSHVRRIAKPYGTLLIAVDGTATTTGWSADMNAGTVTFSTPPASGAVLTWGGSFHVPVRFDGKLDQTALRGEYGDIPSIPLRELKL